MLEYLWQHHHIYSSKSINTGVPVIISVDEDLMTGANDLLMQAHQIWLQIHKLFTS